MRFACLVVLAMISENAREAPHLVKGIVKRSGRDADHVWLAEIAFHPGGDQLIVQLLWMLVHQDG